MRRIVSILALMIFSTSVIAQSPPASVEKIAAQELVAKIQSGAFSHQHALRDILDEQELIELRSLASCTPVEQTHYFSVSTIYDWSCSKDIRGSSLNKRRLTTKMQFGDDGALLGLAINPFIPRGVIADRAAAPDDIEVEISIAQRFADAVEKNIDPTLGGLIPITPLQLHQIKHVSGARARVLKPAPFADRQRIKQRFGDSVEVYEPLEGGFRVEIVSKDSPRKTPTIVSIFFDGARKPIGMQTERPQFEVVRTRGK